MPSTRRNGVRSNEIGRETEDGIVRVLKASGFPGAERRRVRRQDALDILVSPGVIVSAKGGKYAKTASLKDLTDWKLEAQAKRAEQGADVCLLVVQRNGYGRDRAENWRTWVLGPFVMGPGYLDNWETDLVTASYFVRSLGYGTPLEASA
jgi:hypothetical protein